MTRDDRGSLAIALLVTLVGVLLTSLLVPVMLAQISTTRRTAARDQALRAAQTGLDVALGHVRAARSAGTGTEGDLTRLPCGPVRGPAGIGRYEVTIEYLAGDPQGKDAAWLIANRIPCAGGGGALRTPQFASFRSRGTSASATRTLRGVYRVRTTNQNIAGGPIHLYRPSGGTDLCMDAGADSPSPGTPLYMRVCSPGSGKQTFSYNPNLTLTLVSSRSDALPLGLCLDAGSPAAAGAIVRFQPCATTTQPQQQWSVNDAANFEGTSDGRTLNRLCFNLQNPGVDGSLVILGAHKSGGCYVNYNTKQTFAPEAAVGAGAAGAASGQLVNFSQFGRCIDVTDQKINAAFLIVWPCKQAPDPTAIAWNQKWTLPTIPDGAGSATGLITTKPPSGNRCLRSPGNPSAGYYVTIVSCPSSASREVTWTVHTNTGNYETGYRIIDGYGYCLSPTDPKADPPDFFTGGQGVSKLVVAACSGSTLQKWNAPPDTLKSLPLKDIGED
ncbi:RICIN domain-containing protein [Spirillospora albida]|uniref:RICIN domain-containing protein n=1 Tax=Spirillospora albida TaxID=58123 RepID=UPI0004C02C00|nr:RICIN domain-containing protein [Spirillospora albida]